MLKLSIAPFHQPSSPARRAIRLHSTNSGFLAVLGAVFHLACLNGLAAGDLDGATGNIFKVDTVNRGVEPLTEVEGGTDKASSREQKSDDEALLTLPIRFHVTQGATMTVKGRRMEVWVQPSDLTGPVLQEINRIWKPASIQFTVERAQVEPLLQPADFAGLLKNVENSKRGDEEEFGSRRTESIAKLLDPAQRHPSALNVYLLPYIGATYQGG